MFTLPIAIAGLLALIPYLAAAFFGVRLKTSVQKLPVSLQILAPASLSVPYLIVASSNGMLGWHWLALYAILPMVIAAITLQVRKTDPAQHGDWREYLLLGLLGLAVDLRWFEAAWPPHLAVLNKVLLLDAGIYGFQILRELDGVGFDLRLEWRDLRIGVQEFLFYSPIALVVGLSIGFLHLHSILPSLFQFSGAFVFTFFFIA